MASREASQAPVLSVSIVTYHLDPALFGRALDSLVAAARRVTREGDAPVAVTVIDNGDQEERVRALAAEREDPSVHFEVIGGIRNIGYGRGHNLAILPSRARYHLVLNPDVLLDEDCLRSGVRFLRDNDGEVCAVAPHATDSRGNVQYLCKRFPAILDLFLRGFAPRAVRRLFRRRLRRYELRDTVTGSRVVDDVPLISGCFMLCDTRVLKKVGGFDERFFLYFEDFALSMEMQRHGRLAYLPAMRIQHFGGHSARKGLNHILMFARSGIRFFNTYGWKFL